MRRVASTLSPAIGDARRKTKAPPVGGAFSRATPCWAHIFFLCRRAVFFGASYAQVARQTPPTLTLQSMTVAVQTTGAPSLTQAQPRVSAFAGALDRSPAASSNPPNIAILGMECPHEDCDGATRPLSPAGFNAGDTRPYSSEPKFLMRPQGRYAAFMWLQVWPSLHRRYRHGSDSQRRSKWGRDRPIRLPGIRRPAARLPRPKR